jgi:DNA-binding response OmpR family regulator
MRAPRILIVEDEGLIATDIEAIVVRSGFETAGVFAEVMRADELLKSDARIDAALLDIVIKDQNSYRLCKSLDKRGIPFGFVTGLRQDEIEKPWRDRPYVEKPYEVSDIQRMLRELTTDDDAVRLMSSDRSETWE